MSSPGLQAASSSSSFVPPSHPQWKYDVFLSFRGGDTSKNFTDHLYEALKRKGIIVFRDNLCLERGKDTAELLRAIEKSRFTIVIFSRDYASSTWCLDEVVKCMDTKGQVIFPVFYDVDSSDVSDQTGNYEKAFAKHEEHFGENKERVKIWRNALTRVANLSGWDAKNKHESRLIHEIAEEIFSRLDHSFSSSSKDLIGIDFYVEELKSYFDTSSNDVRIVGIHGMGGIGKTTVARVIFDRISKHFEASSFLANVREVSERNGLVPLQQQLLCETLKKQNINLWDVHRGMNMIKNRLCRKRVLVVLDDVDKLEQLEALVGEHCWYGLGSRIIITTRNSHVLVQHHADVLEHRMDRMNHEDALKLFSLKAFKSVHPKEDFLELSKEVVDYAHGVPLALEVLGSFLCGKTIDEWVSAVARIRRDSKKEILDILEISWHGLETPEKEIFLDVACFFKGMDKNYLIKLLNSFDFYAAIGIRVLVDKSLLTIAYNNKVWMHDLLQGMGQKIVWKESPDEPGKRSRLWVDEDVYHVLSKDSGTRVVEMMNYNSYRYEAVHLSAKAFSKMAKLRLLKLSNVKLPQGLEYLSNELRVLEWQAYPLESLPSSFEPGKIIELEMKSSCIKELWRGTRALDKLESINLSHSQDLIRTPDLSGAPNLEKLVLEGCTSLIEVHSSTWSHKGLVVLNMKGCRSFWRLPNSIEMLSLRVLNLSGCSELKMFPEVEGNMECLSELHLDGTAIDQLPLSIEHLTGLKLLNLNNCIKLIDLPSSICHLNSLTTLSVSGCSNLDKLPEKFGNVHCLEELDVGGTAITQFPSSMVLLKNLKTLSIRELREQPPSSWNSLLSSLLLPRKNPDSMCLSLPPLSSLHSLTSMNLSKCNLPREAVPSDICCLSSLKTLDLSDNDFVSLPSSISQLSNLEYLHLEGCKSLQSLPELPASLTFVGADDCVELKNFPNPVKLCNSTLSRFNLFNCNNLISYLDCSSLAWTWLRTYLKRLPRSSNGFDVCLPGSEIPKWLSYQHGSSSVSIDLPPHWNNSNLMGFAMCAIFRLRAISALAHRNTDMKPYHRKANNVILACFFTNDQGTPLVNIHTGAWFPNCSLVRKCTQIGSDHMWLLYRRSNLDIGTLNELDRLTLSFNRQYGSGWDLEIQGCGLRLVYAQDLEELQLGESGSSIEEPQPKRLKEM